LSITFLVFAGIFRFTPPSLPLAYPPPPVTHSRRPDQAEKAQKKQGSLHRPNTLYHNTAANTIRTPYTVFYISSSISIPPNNKSM
jgi:hypothetical protein